MKRLGSPILSKASRGFLPNVDVDQGMNMKTSMPVTCAHFQNMRYAMGESHKHVFWCFQIHTGRLLKDLSSLSRDSNKSHDSTCFNYRGQIRSHCFSQQIFFHTAEITSAYRPIVAHDRQVAASTLRFGSSIWLCFTSRFASKSAFPF